MDIETSLMDARDHDGREQTDLGAVMGEHDVTELEPLAHGITLRVGDPLQVSQDGGFAVDAHDDRDEHLGQEHLPPVDVAIDEIGRLRCGRQGPGQRPVVLLEVPGFDHPVVTAEAVHAVAQTPVPLHAQQRCGGNEFRSLGALERHQEALALGRPQMVVVDDDVLDDNAGVKVVSPRVVDQGDAQVVDELVTQEGGLVRLLIEGQQVLQPSVTDDADSAGAAADPVGQRGGLPAGLGIGITFGSRVVAGKVDHDGLGVITMGVHEFVEVVSCDGDDLDELVVDVRCGGHEVPSMVWTPTGRLITSAMSASVSSSSSGSMMITPMASSLMWTRTGSRSLDEIGPT